MSPSIESKELIVVLAYESGIVSKKPCWLYSIHSHSGFAFPVQIIVYDSSVGREQPVLDMIGLRGYRDNFIFTYPIFFNRGIYIYIGGTFTNVVTTLIPVH